MSCCQYTYYAEGCRDRMMERYKPKVNKQTLFLLAGLLWCLAGWRVLAFGYEDFFINARPQWTCLLISVAAFLVFFGMIFNQMVQRHNERIRSSSLVKHCAFSFLDIKGYLVMFFMMSGGILLRRAHIIQPTYLGSFYLGLGSALFLAGMKSLTSALYF
jgi:hypothetical protein